MTNRTGLFKLETAGNKIAHGHTKIIGLRVRYGVKCFFKMLPVGNNRGDSAKYPPVGTKEKSEGKWKDFPDYGSAKKGGIALQDHGQKAYFKNIMIRVL